MTSNDNSRKGGRSMMKQGSNKYCIYYPLTTKVLLVFRIIGRVLRTPITSFPTSIVVGGSEAGVLKNRNRV